MKTTEAFIEQLLIGLLLFLVLVLPFVGKLSETIMLLTDNFERIGAGIAIAGLVYMCGIVLDRWIDTLMENIEQIGRLDFALKRPGKKSAVERFPEHLYRIQILDSGSAIADYALYLRSRIRIARALTVMAPALTISLLLYLAPELYADRVWVISALAVPFTYFLALLLQLIRGSRTGHVAPRTNASEVDIEIYMKTLCSRRGIIRLAVQEPVTWGLL